MPTAAEALARWAHAYESTPADRVLAQRALEDTVGVTLAARDDPLRKVAAQLPDAARWAAIGHVLDFDDLHMASTTHISVVCVPTVLATGGDARAYLGGAGVMARLGTALGWPHYSSGWHATCTAGAPAAAVAASLAMGLDERRTATAIALAVPAAGGVQRAFGSAAKSLQVGFAADAGVRAARLAAAGAEADLSAVEQWLHLMGGDVTRVDLSGPAVPGGLAIKIYPCCYALQRPIAAMRRLLAAAPPFEAIETIKVRTPEGTVHPLIHSRPRTGLEGKFSLEYALASAFLDTRTDFDSFTTGAVNRPEARDLVERVETTLTPGGDWLLAGDVQLEIIGRNGINAKISLEMPPGSPGLPPSDAEMRDKLAACGEDIPDLLAQVDWALAREILTQYIPAAADPAPTTPKARLAGQGAF